MIDQNAIEKAIGEACADLYKRGRHLLLEKAQERTIVADFIAPHLRTSFPGWDVTTEYNREGIKRDPKKDLDGNLLIPDIIIHKFGPYGPNLVAIQVKGYWNREDREKDETSLRNIRAKHGYKYLFRLELGPDKYELVPIR
jgi:hypothetical protein